ncbi:MAG: type II secretion system F family protein [Candidatus Limnocylindrales bacterium]
MFRFVLGLVSGIAIGAAAANLSQSQSGADLRAEFDRIRADIQQGNFDELGAHLEERFKELQSNLEQRFAEVQEAAAEVSEEAEKAAEDVADDVEAAAKEAREEAKQA